MGEGGVNGYGGMFSDNDGYGLILVLFLLRGGVMLR